MTINGNRRFKGNDGKSYLVQGKKGAYFLTVLENGFYKIRYDLTYNIKYFKTIKDAQRDVLFSEGSYQTI